MAGRCPAPPRHRRVAAAEATRTHTQQRAADPAALQRALWVPGHPAGAPPRFRRTFQAPSTIGQPKGVAPGLCGVRLGSWVVWVIDRLVCSACRGMRTRVLAPMKMHEIKRGPQQTVTMALNRSFPHAPGSLRNPRSRTVPVPPTRRRGSTSASRQCTLPTALHNAGVAVLGCMRTQLAGPRTHAAAAGKACGAGWVAAYASNRWHAAVPLASPRPVAGRAMPDSKCYTASYAAPSC